MLLLGGRGHDDLGGEALRGHGGHGHGGLGEKLLGLAQEGRGLLAGQALKSGR